MAQVTYTYPNGSTITKAVSSLTPRTFGDKIDGVRPIQATIKGEVSDEFLYTFVAKMLDPTNRFIIYIKN